MCVCVCVSEGERERAGPKRRATKEKEERKNGTTQMALMAGILFTATFLVLGTSSLVSAARIYPPNEGKSVLETRDTTP